MQKLRLVIFLALFLGGNTRAELKVTIQKIGEHSYVSQSDLKKLNLKIFIDLKKDRILVEGVKKTDQAIFLLNSPYAVIDGKLYDTKNAPIIENGDLYIPLEILQSYLLPFSDQKLILLEELGQFQVKLKIIHVI